MRAPDPSWEQNVVVVPNPYHAQGADKYSGKSLIFLNIPAYANIDIYTMTGDRVRTIRHSSGTGNDRWEKQDNGIYIFVVEELDGPNGAPTGKKTIGKFVVIH